MRESFAGLEDSSRRSWFSWTHRKFSEKSGKNVRFVLTTKHLLCQGFFCPVFKLLLGAKIYDFLMLLIVFIYQNRCWCSWKLFTHTFTQNKTLVGEKRWLGTWSYGWVAWYLWKSLFSEPTRISHQKWNRSVSASMAKSLTMTFNNSGPVMAKRKSKHLKVRVCRWCEKGQTLKGHASKWWRWHLLAPLKRHKTRFLCIFCRGVFLLVKKSGWTHQ